MTAAAPTLAQALDEATGQLTGAGITADAARADTRLLAAHACQVAPGDLDTCLAGPVPPRFWHYVRRRLTREPAERIVGHAYFMGHRFDLAPGVFVPKPETEEITRDAIARLEALVRRGTPAPLVVDLCAGPGTMAVTLARHVPAARVLGIELSQAAARAARRNARGTGARIVQGDARDAFPELSGTVDLVVTNPPYIPIGLRTSAPEVLEHDPPLALWAGEEGLGMIRAMERTAARLLAPGGVLLLEHGSYQLASVPALFRATGRWSHASSRPTCNDGCLTAVRNHTCAPPA
ncbi:N5-glutamine methyltransferase family protein [Streptomyces pristinaespiralis]|uniref:Methyltransferase n=2 Tax=Streptomyces pristinaespiralis TaxID=38300 RepID=D6X7H7_STRE2|nr:HemK/PrmC family methyltransferase [Streptomyces pristinaespiralis]ALC18609.1 PapM [Streptomyces pristinaespiralis]ALC25356.1 PapM [Streptomyces pristinaespiralis]EFH32221.1 methyltransferase [Streptomyces pristinaespiralis ATCC 25486]QMU12424.1 peptide chain release factor N(5)-glutamine methyltransferase [Streptomyces pristinaespiralis]CBW45752.1 N-methylase [Streptomyces pristinaespiralis]